MNIDNRHIEWIIDNDESITLTTGDAVKIFNLKHENDSEILSNWAKHLRNHYCLDEEIDFYRTGYNISRLDYLNQIIFPDISKSPGPSTRAGDFGEILVADYLEYIHDFWVPRTRYGDKTIRNESTKGSDVIGFKFVEEDKDSLEDTLAIYETKTAFSKSNKNRLQQAVDDSSKDYIRKAESLNAVKQRLYQRNQKIDSIKIERFQDLEDRPYTELYGAAVLFCSSFYDVNLLAKTDISKHQRVSDLALLIIYGDEMMKLVHEIYRRAADEA